MNKRLRWGIC